MTTYVFQIKNFFKILLSILWQSVSSADFYKNVKNNYYGYGIKYLITLCVIFSLITSAEFIVKINMVIYSLQNGPEDNSTRKNLNSVLDQIPTLNYDGEIVKPIKADFSRIVTMPDGNKVIALDFENNMLPLEMVKFPIVMRKNNISIHITTPDPEGKLIDSFTIGYSKILGEKAEVIDRSILYTKMLELLLLSVKLVTYIAFPVMGLLMFVAAVYDKLFIIILLYFISRILKKSIDFKSCVRAALFASGWFIFSNKVLDMLPEAFSQGTFIINIWIIYLLISGTMEINIKNYLSDGPNNTN